MRGGISQKNDLNAILDKIARDAKEYEQKSMEAARKNAELIEADYRRQAEAESAEALAAAKAQAEASELKREVFRLQQRLENRNSNQNRQNNNGGNGR